MATIIGQPYAPIKKQKYRDVTILSIQKETFEHLEVIPGRIVVFFEECAFQKLVIENEVAIDFEDISIGFSNCYIGELDVENIVSRNISVMIMGSVAGLSRFKSDSLKSVALSNTDLLNGVFVTGVQHVEIQLAKDRIQPGSWNSVLEFIGHKNDEGIPAKQDYRLYNCSNILYSTDLEEANPNVNLSFHLALTYGGGQPDTSTVVKKAHLTSLSMNGSPSGKLNFEDVKVDSWYLHDFSPKGEASFFNIDVPVQSGSSAKMEIHQCNLDNAWFDNIRFDHFSILTLYRSKLSKTKFTSCSFPSDYAVFIPVENVHYPNKRTASYNKDQYEMFLQLKNALETTGNAYEAYKFQALALQALRNLGDLSGEDKLLLRLNNLSNRHGLSIWWPFFWFLVSSILLYLLYLLSLGRIFHAGQFDPSLIGYYFAFLDLTHKSDFLVAKPELTGWSLFIDYLSKVVIGYLIYQFIAAFRKYSKKSLGSV